MIRREFVWVEEDPDTGRRGWRLEKQPDFDPVTEYGVAHDAMEHFDQSGTIEEEGRAFGAILWGRHQGRWWSRRGSWSTEFLEAVGDEWAESVVNAGSVSRTRTYRLKCEAAEEQIQSAMECATEVVHNFGVGDRDWSPELAAFADWVRIGYRLAERRWGRHMSPFKFCDLFSKIADRPLTSYKFVPGSELDRLVICVSPKNRTVQVNLIKYQDPYA